jgi:tRNA C32,U32 (ribose-2'-O)-methylase TrmJ
VLSEDELGRLCVVLVRARDPNNIGAVARAMYDFGFRDLRLVNEYPVPLERARSAIDASSVLESAREFLSVAEAVADCTLVAGTTAVGLRRKEHPLHTLAEAGPLLRAELSRAELFRAEASPTKLSRAERTFTAPKARVALLFGSEKTGLSNEELSHCHWLLTIPMHQTEGMRHASMNLGQAAAVCLYELIRNPEAKKLEAESLQELLEPATAEDLERLTQLTIEVMETSGYAQRHPANFDETLVRRLVLHMGLDRPHALAWTGVLRQVMWKLHGGSDQSAQAAETRNKD